MFLSKYFWISFSLFVLNQLLERIGVFIPYVHSYLDDVLCAGIVLGFALFIQQQITYRNTAYTLGMGNLIFFVIWYSLIFEWFLPSFDSRHHRDLWDILAYASGTFLFYKFGNKPAHGLMIIKIKTS